MDSRKTDRNPARRPAPLRPCAARAAQILPPVSRRDFLKTAATVAAGTAALSVGLDSAGNIAAAAADGGLVTDFVRVYSDNRVVVVIKHFEAGQGPTIGLATLAAEEMHADWAQVETVFAPADNERYANLAWGLQGTGGSSAMANSFMQYRNAGALALARLRAAAAKEWGVAEKDIRAANGALSHGKRRATFGEMAAAAAAQLPGLPEGAEPELKQPADFALIGRDRLQRKDMAGKTDGSTVFAMDFRPPNALFAVVARAPKFGGALKSFDDSAARKVRGCAGAKAIPAGVAVYGETPWAAIKGRRALRAEWDFSQAETRSSKQMFADYWRSLEQPGLPARADGDADAALGKAAQTVAADFEFPFLAHAPMEPLNCVIQFRDGKVTLWDGCQIPGAVQGAVAGVFGVEPQQVDIVSLFAGGTFGRRATPTNDYQMEAAHALKASPDASRPLRLFWTREDDIRGGFYRPMYVHRVRAGIDADGRMLAWRQDLAGKPILIGTAFEAFVKDGVDPSSVEGAATLPYAVPNLRVEVRNLQDSPVPVLWWRSVGHTHTAYSTEIVTDMLAQKAGADPVEFRLSHLQDHPRHAGVLRRVAAMSGWGKPAPAGRFRGVAVHESFNSYVAQVAEISLTGAGAVKVEKVWCAVDCGVAVNPDVIRAQMESCIGYGLGAAMRNQVTLKEGGEVEQSNFPDYMPLRMRDMPAVEVGIVQSDEPPTGVGEPGLPPVAPALANAIFAATGKRVTSLPLAAHGVKFA